MPDDVLAVLHRAHGAVAEALADLQDWQRPGTRRNQYACDLAADDAAFRVLDEAGFGVVSEERASHRLDRDVVVVVDPVDGTANAVRGIPYYATSLCAVDAEGMAAALVVNLATGTTFEAERGQGARCDGEAIRPAVCESLAEATIALSGSPRTTTPWRHMRAFGATALELCDLARGLLDAYINTDEGHVAPWDYLGALLVCQEAGAVAGEGRGQPLVTLDDAERRSPMAAASPALLDEAMAYAWPGASASTV